MWETYGAIRVERLETLQEELGVVGFDGALGESCARGGGGFFGWHFCFAFAFAFAFALQRGMDWKWLVCERLMMYRKGVYLCVCVKRVESGKWVDVRKRAMDEGEGEQMLLFVLEGCVQLLLLSDVSLSVCVHAACTVNNAGLLDLCLCYFSKCYSFIIFR